MRHVPWHVQGVRPDAQDVARDAARRSGLSVGEWLNSLIVDATTREDPATGGYREPAPPNPPARAQPTRDADARFAAIRDDIDELKWQIDRLAHGHGGRPTAPTDPDDGPRAAELAQSIARLERRLEGLSREGGSPADTQVRTHAESRGGDRVGSQTGSQVDSRTGPGAGPARNFGVDDAFAEIAARQHLLDAETPEMQPFDAPAGDREMPRPQFDLSGIEQQLRDIGARIAAPQAASRCDTMAAEVARTIERAAPKRALEAIEEQLRQLTAQIESIRPSAQVDHLVVQLRRDLADIGHRINDAMPQRSVAAIEEQIRVLSSQVAGLKQPRAEDIAEVLRKDFAEFRASFNDTAPPPLNLAPIEAQMRALAGEVAKLHPPLRIEDVAHALRRDLDEIGIALKDTIPQRAVASIEEQVQSLSAQVSRLNDPAPIEEFAKVLRQDLVEIGAVLHDAMPTQAIVALEQEVRALGERLESSRGQRADSPATVEFEHALAEIHNRLQALTPAEDIAQLGHAVTSLSRKADAIASDGAAPELLHQLEHAIGALHGLASQVASQDAVAGLSRDIHTLADKFDRSSRLAADPDIMASLEQRLAEMAEAVGRNRPAESPAVPANFDAIIKTLADRLEATQIPAADQGALKSLEQRIVNLVDKLEQSEARIGRQELERQDRDRQDGNRQDGDREDGADRGMDELLTQLKELRTQNEHKLHAIQQQLVASATEAISGPAEAIRRDVASLKEIQSSTDRRTQDTFEAVYGTIEQVVDRLATIEEGLRTRPRVDHAATLRQPPDESVAAPMKPSPAMVLDAPTIVPTASPMADRAASVPAIDPPVLPESTGKAAPGNAPNSALGNPPSKPAATPFQARQAIVSDLPPDAPLEPGSGARRVRVVANAIDRIAASEAVNGPATPADAAPPARANFVAAARRAAQAVASEQGDAPAARTEKTVEDKQKAAPGKLMQKLGPRIKSVVLGISVILLVLGALRLALDLFYNPDASTPPVTRMDGAAPPAGETMPSAPESPPPASDPPRNRKGAGLGTPTLSGRRSASIVSGDPLGQMPTSGVLPEPVGLAHSAIAQPSAAIPAPAAAAPDTTASLPIRNPLMQGSAGSLPIRNPLIQGPANHDTAPQAAVAPARELTPDLLPPAIGAKALIAAATAGEPGASYEVATRFAEGRNVPQDLAMAAAWFDRAARSGLAPAQFRLGSMYEKGIGIKKDLQEARRLYVAATDKGHAKAMHNLAVLYAEGLEGTPDYAMASQWFRKAAAHGVVDSQYNLAILYARGVGIERNIAESYKWFALAAKGGDKDAAKKRDEIAARLDAPQLEAAKQAVEAFVAEPQPDEATATKAPPGGWDQVAAAAAPAKTKAARQNSAH